jgi:hypothetical protein
MSKVTKMGRNKLSLQRVAKEVMESVVIDGL